MAFGFLLSGWLQQGVLIVADQFPAAEILAGRLKQDEGTASTILKQNELPSGSGTRAAVVAYVHKKLAVTSVKAMADYTDAKSSKTWT